MNEFVNYQKRGVELPPGCKDLFDVLHIGRSPEVSSSLPSVPAETLTDLGRRLALFISSNAAFRALWIDCKATCVVSFFDGKHGLRSLVLVDASREQAVRDLFVRAGHTLIQDDLLQDNTRGLQFALASPVGFENFVRKLLTFGFGVMQDSPLEFRFHEKNAA